MSPASQPADLFYRDAEYVVLYCTFQAYFAVRRGPNAALFLWAPRYYHPATRAGHVRYPARNPKLHRVVSSAAAARKD